MVVLPSSPPPLHLSLSSLRYYLIDLHRLIPAEAPNQTPHLAVVPNAALFRRLRPDFAKNWQVCGGVWSPSLSPPGFLSILSPLSCIVCDPAFLNSDAASRVSYTTPPPPHTHTHLHTYPRRPVQTPLSSDAFSRFGEADPDHHRLDADVADATRHLVTEVVPAAAAHLDTLLADPANYVPGVVGTELHKFGVNIRHLGLLRKHLTTNSAKDAVLVVSLGRCGCSGWGRSCGCGCGVWGVSVWVSVPLLG
jgi:hypothetical protein